MSTTRFSFYTCIAVIALSYASTATADWSGNVGWASEYHYRGILQKTSSASAGIDFAKDGFYAGIWTADVGDGQEVDGYVGYAASIAEIEWMAGFTGYYYTGNFDDTYQELNLGASMGIVSLDVAVGEYENFTGPTLDYAFASLTIEKDGLYGKLGTFSRDFDGDYVGLGYGTTVADLDVGVALILANDDLIGDADETLLLTVGKTFQF